MPPKKQQVKKFAHEQILHDRDDKNYKYKVIRVKRTDKKHFNMDSIRDYYNEMKLTNNFKRSNVAIEAMGIQHQFTLKYFKNDYFYDIDDYYKDKVHDANKFDDFEYFDVVLKTLK